MRARFLSQFSGQVSQFDASANSSARHSPLGHGNEAQEQQAESPTRFVATLPGRRVHAARRKTLQAGAAVITAMIQLRRALREQYGDDWSRTVLGRGHTLSEQDDLYGDRLLGRTLSQLRR
jgi:hypothetical protein